jgi:hypothetical protein
VSSPGRCTTRSWSSEHIGSLGGKRNLFKVTDHRNETIPKRLEVYESAGVQPVFLTQAQAISYAEGRACFRSGEIRILDSSGAGERAIAFSEADRKL